ncbi:Na+/H+ antiporter subunit E [Devosia submarina]|uniref:Na+/H+ antiporter subunit E n=1 Tax=Devosia submarina TaxID=1173082 RepID=UPI000D34B846|nr:Na+/H+ antiporter subunit E [Devosia submarina]
MRQIVLGVALVLLWAAITANFSTPNLALGALVALGALAFLRRSFSQPLHFRKLRALLGLSISFCVELMLSAIRVARVVLTPDLDRVLRPAIFAFPLGVKSDAEIATLANLITLTPGTLSVDVSDDRTMLYVHVLQHTTREAFIAELQNGFERQVREVFA